MGSLRCPRRDLQEKGAAQQSRERFAQGFASGDDRRSLSDLREC
jgi:hypothetical protein